MSKKSKAAQDYSRATPQLIKQVRAVLADADAHKYSVSRVYAAYNAVFGKRDQPQTCSSCLRNRVRELRLWIAGIAAQGTAPDVSAYLGSEVPSDALEAEIEAFLKGMGITPESDAVQRYNALNAAIQQFGPVMTTDQHTDAQAALARMALEIEAQAAPPADPNAPGHSAPAEGVVRFPMGADFLPIDFTPSTEDEAKGTVLYADGSKVKAGTYATATGHEIAVQPGGKATIKHEDLT